MALLTIIKGIDNKILRTKSVVVKKIDRKIKKLIADLSETMIGADGLGIAAPQAGVNKRILIAYLNFNTKNKLIVPMINAEILKQSQDEIEGEEGCLSVPGRFGIVLRSKSLTVRYIDKNGREMMLNLEELNARIVQHEIDHLDGILFVDKIVREITPEERREKRDI